MSWVMGKDGNVRMRAIQMITEQLDGKPTQTIDQTTKEIKKVNYKIINGGNDWHIKASSRVSDLYR